VVERYTATGTQRGALGDLPPSGRTATLTGINIFRIACGRIAEVWSEVDGRCHVNRHGFGVGAIRLSARA
jgi:predicted ester cyclase